MPNTAHWRRATNDVQYETEAQSARPLHALCSTFSSSPILYRKANRRQKPINRTDERCPTDISLPLRAIEKEQ
jgi:hypothetical protein